MQPECSSVEARQLRDWYLSELRSLQDELDEIRREQVQDRALIRELQEMMHAYVGVNYGITLQ